MELKSMQDFSWTFLQEIAWWSMGIAAAIAVAALVATNDAKFAVACLLAAAIDLAFIRGISSSARREIEEGRPGAGTASLYFVARLLAKAGLLVLAVLLPTLLSFPGTVVGVLCFDLTLAVVGSLIAATRLIGGPRVGR